MKKSFRGILAAVMALGVLMTPALLAAQTGYYYWFQMQDVQGEPFTENGEFSCSIYQGAGSGATIAQIHANSSFNLASALPQPIYSDRNGRVHFYSTSDTTFRAACYSKYGRYGVLERLDRTGVKSLRVEREPLNRISRFQYTTNTSPTVTNIVIPKGGRIVDVLVVPSSPPQTGPTSTCCHLNVGFDGNHAVATGGALVAAMDISGGYNADSPLRPIFVVNGAATVNRHRGAALRYHVTTNGYGSYGEVPYLVHVSSGLTVTYSTTSAASQGGHVYILWDQTHLGVLGQRN